MCFLQVWVIFLCDLSPLFQVHWFEQQIVKSRKKRDFVVEAQSQTFHLNDPYYSSQWYLVSRLLGSLNW